MASETKKPNFFIVGAAKCGTTAMFDYLSQHPDIFMPAVKEPNHFGRQRSGPRGNAYADEAAYLKLFASAKNEKRLGEASPGYLLSPDAAHKIHAFDPNAKIIIMLRSPVDLIYSSYYHRRSAGSETAESFEDALGVQEDAEDGDLTASYWNRTKFTEPVRRYFDTFGRENVHIIIYDDLRDDVAAVYRRVLEFLGVDPDFQAHFEIVNASKQVRNPALQRMLIQLKLTPMHLKYSPLSKIGQVIPPKPRKALLNMLRSAYMIEKRPPKMDAELRKKLQQKCLPEVEQLSELLGRDLTHWCRD